MISKTSPHALSPTLYALHLALHFVTTYSHIHKSFISLDQLRWSRISVKGEPHRHSFVRDGDEKRKVEIEVRYLWLSCGVGKGTRELWLIVG